MNAVAFSPKGEYCVSGGNDNHIFVWKLNLEVDGQEVVKEKVVQEVTTNVNNKPETSRVPMRVLDDDLRQLEIEEKENKAGAGQVNQETLQQLKSINKNLNTLTQTVLLMEKRLTLVEDQIKLMGQK